MALLDRSWNRSRTSTSARKRTPRKWNQDKTSIAIGARHVDFRCRGQSAGPWAGARGVLEWKTSTWSRNRTTSLRSRNRTRTRLSDRTRTRTSWNQDKTSIVASTSAPPGAGGARRAVGGAEAALGAGGARGVLEWKTRAWTKNRTP